MSASKPYCELGWETTVGRQSRGRVEQEAVLENLLDEVDQVALLKARALYALHLAGAQAPAD